MTTAKNRVGGHEFIVCYMCHDSPQKDSHSLIINVSLTKAIASYHTRLRYQCLKTKLHSYLIGYDIATVGVRVPIGSRNFSTSSRPVLRPTQAPTQWVPWALPPGVKRQGREADYSPLTSAEVNNTWIYTSPPPHVFMARCLIS
jgi:hypothetical protein